MAPSSKARASQLRALDALDSQWKTLTNIKRGEILLVEREQAVHGTWLPFLEKAGISQPSASDYMLVARAANHHGRDDFEGLTWAEARDKARTMPVIEALEPEPLEAPIETPVSAPEPCFMVEINARELGRIDLHDALSMLAIMEGEDDQAERFERAVAKWAARFVLESPGVRRDDLRAALDALDALPSPEAQEALTGLLTRHGHRAPFFRESRP